MNNWLYILYALVLGVVAFFTGEIVTFIMGLILIALININNTLKKMVKKMKIKILYQVIRSNIS